MIRNDPETGRDSGKRKTPIKNTPPTLDIAYYPDEAGPYNTASDFGAVGNKWAGTMRALTVTDFEQANIEYLQFWMLHPLESSEVGEGGKLVLDLVCRLLLEKKTLQ